MTGTTMIVLIVFISVGFGVMYDMYKKHLEFKEKTFNLNQQNDLKNESLEQKITTLEHRIQVLEKIVTDEGYSVQKDINNL
ncbi:hypothetical protein CJF42_11790 [Pseudoalteromonas sp. NBT06-2]|uniref:hypothetical protein n=1 Tax=Pseudoalteromonas sp. NBT06-2 TaxID=2025950 RepID=UPI000BA4F31E|nr:hypothetical protein [Pseudoalteromonas sp. NBT06-2]PAJ74163.1 hypothetical protein CJF42_11790 [Pseudoalteromonas sp. NBT06-2]